MNAIHRTKENLTAQSSPTTARLRSCRKLISAIEKTKEAILIEFRERIETREHLLRLALNEAEAVAWQSGFPQLVFPTLAMEKAQAVTAWHVRQRTMRRNSYGLAYAA